MAISIIDTFPPEPLTMVAALVEPEDYLSLKLSCKTFAQIVPETLPTIINNHYLRKGRIWSDVLLGFSANIGASTMNWTCGYDTGAQRVLRYACRRSA